MTESLTAKFLRVLSPANGGARWEPVLIGLAGGRRPAMQALHLMKRKGLVSVIRGGRRGERIYCLTAEGIREAGRALRSARAGSGSSPSVPSRSRAARPR